MSDSQDTQPLTEPLKAGDAVQFAGQDATVHRVSGDVIEIAIPTVKYLTVSRGLIIRGN